MMDNQWKHLCYCLWINKVYFPTNLGKQLQLKPLFTWKMCLLHFLKRLNFMLVVPTGSRKSLISRLTFSLNLDAVFPNLLVHKYVNRHTPSSCSVERDHAKWWCLGQNTLRTSCLLLFSCARKCQFPSSKEDYVFPLLLESQSVLSDLIISPSPFRIP